MSRNRVKKKTHEELAETQTDRVVEALCELKQAARDYVAGSNGYNERRLVQKALQLARRVRRIAGVR